MRSPKGNSLAGHIQREYVGTGIEISVYVGSNKLLILATQLKSVLIDAKHHGIQRRTTDSDDQQTNNFYEISPYYQRAFYRELAVYLQTTRRQKLTSEFTVSG